MLQGLRTAVFYVSDLAAARDWYADILGQPPYYDTPYYVGFSVGGFELGLHPDGAGRSPGSGGVSVYWGVEDVPATIKRLCEKGARAGHGPQDVGGGIVLGSVMDPFGNELGVIFNPSFRLA
jgi:predicted enzyme related to lactoylglutathione lyase